MILIKFREVSRVGYDCTGLSRFFIELARGLAQLLVIGNEFVYLKILLRTEFH